MQKYLAGTTVVINIPLEDEDGNPLDVARCDYRVLNEKMTVLIEGGFDTVTDGVVRLSIDASHNMLAPLSLDTLTHDSMHLAQVNGARTIELNVTLKDGNSIGLDHTYIIYPRDRLITGLNSFQNSAESALTASSILEVEEFVKANTDKRITAMVEARDRIARLTLEDSYIQNHLNGRTIQLNNLTPHEYERLSERLKSALRKAQVAEANVILGGGDIIDQLRQDGITSKTIGETHETYRGTAPAISVVSKAALRYLGEFLNHSKKLLRN